MLQQVNLPFELTLVILVLFDLFFNLEPLGMYFAIELEDLLCQSIRSISIYVTQLIKLRRCFHSKTASVLRIKFFHYFDELVDEVEAQSDLLCFRVLVLI